MRAVVLRVDGLDPAPEGQYYEMWFAYNGESMPLVAFNTSDDGSVEVRGAMPAGMGWRNCWITLEGATIELSGDGAEAVPAARTR